jgi:tetratricopeptide (TPR) repeat protein
VRISCLAWVLAAFLVATGWQRSAHAFVRHTLDDQELTDAQKEQPSAAEAYVKAEALLRTADLAGAEKQLARACEQRPLSSLFQRRHCQVLTELGKRDEAIKACTAALSGMTAMDSRALVGALMSGNALAKPKDVADAMREAANARRLNGQYFGDVAFCEIAHHIGDDAMFTACLASLEKNAPSYFETARWRNAHAGTPLWLYWLGWSLLGLVALFMLGQAFWRWFRAPAPHSRKAGTAAALVLALGTAFSPTAHADESSPPTNAKPHFQLSQFAINFDDPESKIPTIQERNANALEFGYFLQDLSAEALKAERKNDYRTAVKFWRASAKAVPDEAVAYSRACNDYQLLGEREHGMEYCGKAMSLHGSRVEDYIRFAELVVSSPLALTDAEVQDLDEAVKHLSAQPEAQGAAAVVECHLGVKLEDEKRLKHCTSVLVKTAPNDPHTLTFQWSLAMKRHNFSEARRLLAAMGKSAMTPEALAQLQAATEEAAKWWKRPFTDPRYGFGLLALLGLGALLVFRKRAQLRGAPAAPSAPAAPAAE